MHYENRYPIYIISKSRWERSCRLTSRALEWMQVPYRIVIEPQEYKHYSKVIDKKKILVLPFSNLGLGGIPARNWVWEHSISEKHKRHWILDDNIYAFFRINRNWRIPVKGPMCFRAAEDFVDRYTNIGMAGFQYLNFTHVKVKYPPFVLNTRIYSCILLDNSVIHRWRGRYNEDTDLSIRILKDGLCTVLFYAFVADKEATMTFKGGNTDELYKDDGRLKMAQSLKQQHPEIVDIVWKWNRWQHQVDYSQFKKNKLIRKPGLVIPNSINNYGMELEIDKEHLVKRQARRVLFHA